MADIFLSYNRDDQATARRFATVFEAQGFSVWWDATLRSGEAYDQVTEEALRSAKAVVVLWSKRSVESRWVRAEATVADRNGTLIPVRIEACDLPVMFELTQTADLSHWQGAAEDKDWQAFLADVQRMLGLGDTEPAASHSFSTRSPAGSGIPAVAVVPFTHRGVEETNFLADDLTEEITRELAQNYYFRVIAAGTMAAWRGKPVDYQAFGQQLDARYLAEARLQYSGENVRLTVQLVDTETASIVWSQRFGRKIADIETSPEELQVAVAAELGEHVMAIERNRAMAKSGRLSAWEHMMRCVAYSRHGGKEPRLRGIEEARAAVAAAPDLGLAHAMFASSLVVGASGEGEALGEARIRESQTHIRRAMELDGENPAVLVELAIAYAALNKKETFLRLAQHLVQIAPNSPRAHHTLGAAYFSLGRTADAIAEYTRVYHLTQYDSHRFVSLTYLGVSYLLEGRPLEAEEALDKALTLCPDFHNALKWKAIVASSRGEEQEALATIRRLREVDPAMSIDQHVWQINRNPYHARKSVDAVATLRRLWAATEGAA